MFIQTTLRSPHIMFCSNTLVNVYNNKKLGNIVENYWSPQCFSILYWMAPTAELLPSSTSVYSSVYFQ